MYVLLVYSTLNLHLGLNRSYIIQLLCTLMRYANAIAEFVTYSILTVGTPASQIPLFSISAAPELVVVLMSPSLLLAVLLSVEVSAAL